MEKYQLITFLLLFENEMLKFICNVTYSPSHRQPSAPMINIRLSLRTASCSYEKVSLAVSFGINGNSYKISTQFDMCICLCPTLYRDAGKQKKNKTNWESSESRVPRKIFAAIGSPALK